MNRTLYSAMGYLLLPVIIARLLLKSLKTPAYRQRIGERLGLIAKIPVPIIWVHCVSVGEFRAATVLIDALIRDYPEHRILVTTTTPTGSEAVQNHYQRAVLHCYFPLDLAWIMRRTVQRINPSLCVLLETEIWPNLIHYLHQARVPTVLINARLSKQSLANYQKFAPSLSKQTLNQLTFIATQNQNSTDRFIELGASLDKIKMLGNIKFDQNSTPNPTLNTRLQNLIGNRKIVVFASTHENEEAQIINAYLHQPINALLIIIPRHPERFHEVFKLIQKNNIKVVKRSSNASCGDAQILLGDSMGEMRAYFDICDIAFIGGSLTHVGGHNMLEAASLAKPIIFGENVFNFAEIAKDLLSNSAAIQVKNANELLMQITLLLDNPTLRRALGTNAQKYVLTQQGASQNILNLIANILT